MIPHQRQRIPKPDPPHLLRDRRQRSRVVRAGKDLARRRHAGGARQVKLDARPDEAGGRDCRFSGGNPAGNCAGNQPQERDTPQNQSVIQADICRGFDGLLYQQSGVVPNFRKAAYFRASAISDSRQRAQRISQKI